MQLTQNSYTLSFASGGIEITKAGQLLYTNRKPVYLFVLDYLCMTNFSDAPYETVTECDGGILASGHLTSKYGSVFFAEDLYRASGDGFSVERRVTVEKAESSEERGFASKITLRPVFSSEIRDYEYFGPGVWYRRNEHVPAHFMGADLDSEYFHWQETKYALPLFAMQHTGTGETVAFSRLRADVKLRSLHRDPYNNYVDPTWDIGSIGMSRPKNSTLCYDDMNTTVTRLPLSREDDPLGIDYVYPSDNGETGGRVMPGLGMNPTRRVIKRFDRIFHPVKEGFAGQYAVQMDFGCYDSFRSMMKAVWRGTNRRLRAPLADTDCALLYENNMKLLKLKTRKYNNSWGLPFLSYLPDAQDQNVDYQYGFVGQQPGIGYQLIRYGDLYQDAEAFEKGVKVVDFWCTRGISPIGAPHIWFNPPLDEFQFEPYWIRMIGDGMENVLDAWQYMRKLGQEKPHWLSYCTAAADWLVSVQNADGSFYRSYDEQGKPCMDSKANTIAVVRFLLQLALATENSRYENAALRAGSWAYDHTFLELEYRGGTCDNADVQDKEAAIYALFGFLSLYDYTGEAKWLEAASGAADYVITWTYTWAFPVVTRHPVHPFNTRNISGQSLIATGHSGADVYMAACSFVFYRLYLLTDDPEYLELAKFLSKNPQQCNDVDGSIGYAIPGLNHEACDFADQVLHGQYHWLPWCTYVEVDPASRLYDAFGTFEIEEAEKLPEEERKRRNKLYKNR